MEVEPETVVGGDVAMDLGSDAALVVTVKTTSPSGFGQHLLDHEGVDLNECELEQMETARPDLLIVYPVGGHLSPLAEEDEVVDVVPVLNDVQTFVDLPARLPPETAFQGRCLFAQAFDSASRRYGSRSPCPFEIHCHSTTLQKRRVIPLVPEIV